MTAVSSNGEYPRPLSVREREWIEWILPRYRPGYKKYREMIEGLVVIGEGRRGKGEIILGPSGDKPDFDEPLASVAAYGSIETNVGVVSVTLREYSGNQISVEIVSHRMDEVQNEIEEASRWTYSTWKPGISCPQCNGLVREVPMHSETSARFVMAFCPVNKRAWVFEESTGMNRLIPVTNYYNELMLHKNMRDPNIALNSSLLFSHLTEYTDADLTYAFFTYNKLRTKVHSGGVIKADKIEKRTLSDRLKRMFLRRAS